MYEMKHEIVWAKDIEILKKKLNQISVYASRKCLKVIAIP